MLRERRARALIPLLVSPFLATCALQSPDNNGVRIVLDEKSAPTEVFRGLMGIPSVQTGPTTVGDFGCFAANITGDGIPSDSEKLSGCTSTDNMAGRGVGKLSEPVGRGVAIEVDVAGGPQRYIDIYGIYPSSGCPGGSAGATGASNDKGYLIGRRIADLTENTTVTIPVAYSGGPESVTCTGHGGAQNTFTAFFDNASGGTSHKIPTCMASGSITSTSPAPDIGTYALSGADVSSMAAIDGNMARLECTGGGGLDTQLGLFKVGLSRATAQQSYTQFTTYFTGRAGKYLATCDGASTPTTTSGPLYVEIFNDATSSWSQVFAISSNTASYSYTLSNPASYVVSSANGIFFRIAGSLVSVGQCSVILLDQFKVVLSN